jgi:hypothetical protein
MIHVNKLGGAGVWLSMIGAGISEPAVMLVFGRTEGPSIFVPSWKLVSSWFNGRQIATSRDLTGELAWRPFSESTGILGSVFASR